MSTLDELKLLLHNAIGDCCFGREGTLVSWLRSPSEVEKHILDKLAAVNGLDRLAREPQSGRDITLVKPDDMIAWLTDLNANWSVLRNTRSFLEGEPSEYWKKFDTCMGEAFELLIALTKLRANAELARTPQPAKPGDGR